jgi:hypothetical protein
MEKSHIWCWYRGGTLVDVFVIERHIAKEVVDIGKEVIAGKDVLLLGVHDEEPVSSCTSASPQNLITSLPYRTTVGGFLYIVGNRANYPMI